MFMSRVKELPLHVPLSEPHAENSPFPEPYFTCLSKSPVKKTPLQVSPTGPPWREMPFTRAFFYISFKVPSKGAAPLHVPLSEPHAERLSVSRVFFYLSLKVPGEEVPTPSSPNGAPMERDARDQSLLLHILPSPQYPSKIQTLEYPSRRVVTSVGA
jgi:hypothetical protein